MTVSNYYYHLLLLIFSLLLITPSYFLTYHKLLHLILKKDSAWHLKIALTIFFTNTMLSFIVTYLVFFKGLNQYSGFFLLLPGILFFLKNLKKITLSFHPTLFRIIYLTFITIFLLSCALPETGWDALSYHFKLWGPFWFNYEALFYEAIPKGLDVLFWYSQALFNDTSLAHFFHFSYLLSISLLFYHQISSYFSIPLAKFISLLIFLLPYGTKISVLGYVDLASACAETLLVFAMINFILYRNGQNIRLIFLSTSAALSIKYTSLTLVFSAYLIFLIYLFVKSNLRPFIRSIRLGDLMFLILPCCFWYAKNLFLYKNPFWPFLLGHPGMSDALYQQLTQYNMASYTFNKTLLNYLLLPIRFTLYRFQEYKLNGFDIFTIKNLKGIDPTFMCSLIGLYCGFKKKHLLAIFPGLVIFTNISIFFMFGSHQHRYILGTLYLNIFLFAYFLNHFRHFKKTVYLLLVPLLIGFFLHGGFFFLCKNSGHALVYPSRLDSYLSANIHDYDLVSLLKQNHIKSKEISFCFYPLSLFYFPSPSPQSIFDTIAPKPILAGDNLEIINQMKSLGIKYFLVHKENSTLQESMLATNKYWDHLQKEKLIKCLALEKYFLTQPAHLVRNESFIFQLY